MAPSPRSALASLLLVAPIPTLGATVALYVAESPVGKAAWMAGKIAFYLLPALWLILVDRRRPGLSPVRRGGIGTGAGLGVAISVVILAVYALLPEGWIRAHLIREVAAKYGFDTRGGYLGIAAWVVLVNSLLEEYAFRWFLFTRCRALLPALPAVMLSAAIFTSHHIVLLAAYGIAVPFVALAAAGVFAGGVAWSWCYHRFGSIWPGYVSHAVVDVAVLAVGWRLLFG